MDELAELRKQIETAEQALRSIALFSPVTAEGCTLADIAFDAMTGIRGPDWHRQAPNPAR